MCSPLFGVTDFGVGAVNSIPVPLICTSCIGLFTALSRFISVASRAPIMLGVYVTPTLQFAPAAMVPPEHWPSVMVNALEPIIAADAIFSGAVPLLITATSCWSDESDGVATASEPKSNASLSSVAAGPVSAGAEHGAEGPP